MYLLSTFDCCDEHSCFRNNYGTEVILHTFMRLGEISDTYKSLKDIDRSNLISQCNYRRLGLYCKSSS